MPLLANDGVYIDTKQTKKTDRNRQTDQIKKNADKNRPRHTQRDQYTWDSCSQEKNYMTLWCTLCEINGLFMSHKFPIHAARLLRQDTIGHLVNEKLNKENNSKGMDCEISLIPWASAS